MLFGIGIVLLVVGVIVSLVSPFLGVLVYLCWYLVRPQELYLGLGGSMPMERIFAIVLFLSTIARFRDWRNDTRNITQPMKAFFALVVINYLTITSSIWRGNSLETADKFAKLFLFFFFAVVLVNTERRLKWFLGTYVSCIAWEAGSTIYNYYAHPYFAQGIQRATSMSESWGDPNATAFNLLFAIPLMLALRNSEKSWKKTFVVLSIMAIALIVIVLTGSRMAFLVGILMFFLLAIRARKRFVILPTTVVLCVLIWALTPMQYKQRYLTVVSFAENPTGQLDTSQGESAYGRWVGFRVGMMIFADHPVLGVGVGNFPQAWFTLPYFFKGFKGWHQPHNLAGQVMSEQGIVGTLGFVVFVVILFRSVIGLRRVLEQREAMPLLAQISRAVPIVLICMLAQGFSSHSYYRYNWYLICSFTAIACRLAAREVKAEEGETEGEFAPAMAESRLLTLPHSIEG